VVVSPQPVVVVRSICLGGMVDADHPTGELQAIPFLVDRIFQDHKVSDCTGMLSRFTAEVGGL